MKRLMKVLAVSGLAVFAFCAVAVASSSAATFHASKTGTLKGHATSTQVFTTNAGEVKCSTAKTTGTVTELEATAQKVKVEYSGCTAFGFVGVTISPAEYNLHSNGEVDILNTIKISVSGLCSQTVGPQSGLGTASYSNNSGKIVQSSAITGITYSSSGGICGSGGSNGTYTGGNEVELEGGTLSYS